MLPSGSDDAPLSVSGFAPLNQTPDPVFFDRRDAPANSCPFNRFVLAPQASCDTVIRHFDVTGTTTMTIKLATVDDEHKGDDGRPLPDVVIQLVGFAAPVPTPG